MECNRCGKGKLYFLINDVEYRRSRKPIIKASIYGCNVCGKLTFEFFDKQIRKVIRND